MAYGSPERLADVPAYYADIRGGRPVAPEHLDDLVARYRRLGIEESNPLNAITEATRAALERELGQPVHTGMKHWRPRIADAVEAALADGATTLVGLVLAPHYSRLSIGGYLSQLEDALAGRAELAFVEWSFSFQSESPTGEPWLGPDILDHLEALHGDGVEHVLVCPVGFVSDHLEIRWDIDTEAQEKARELGLRLERIEMPNDDPRFVRVLAGIVRRTLAPVAA